MGNLLRAIERADAVAAKAVCARRVDREGPVHMAVLNWLRLVLPKGSIVAHIPNEVALSGRDASVAVAKAKGLGLVVGFPDLIVVSPDGVGFIEIKAEGGSLSKDQRETLDALKALGANIGVCRSIEDARETLARWGFQTREARGVRRAAL